MEAKERLLKMMELAKTEAEKLESDLRSAKARSGAFNESVSALGQKGTESAALLVVRRLQDKAKKEQATVAEIEAKIVDARGRVSAFEEAIKLFPKDGDEAELRAGSQMSGVRQALRAHGKPMSLTEILKAIGAVGDDKKRNSLRGSLAGYAREGRVFTKEAAPETFGLIEFGNDASSDEPPAGVGVKEKGGTTPI